MSLDISIHNKRTGDQMEMNWLRNPFGLCNWAEANYAHITGTEPKRRDTLWYVINNWNYKKSPRVNRKKFKQVVDRYWRVIKKLEEGYFFLDVASFMSFVLPNMDQMPTKKIFDQIRIEGNVFHEHMIGIPMEYFNKPCFHLSDASLERYKEWFAQLVEFAKKLQKKSYKFYCSN